MNDADKSKAFGKVSHLRTSDELGGATDDSTAHPSVEDCPCSAANVVICDKDSVRTMCYVVVDGAVAAVWFDSVTTVA